MKNFGLSGQYDNFLCLTKECKERAKQRQQEKTEDRKLKRENKAEKEKLKLEAIRLKNEDKKAKIDIKRSQSESDTAMANTVNAQMSAPLPAPPVVEKQDNTLIYVAAGVGMLLLTGVVILMVKRRPVAPTYVAPH